MGWRYTLGELANICGGEVSGSVDAAFEGVSTDTRSIGSAEIFFALTGENFDGNRFVGQAFESGTAAAVTTVASPSGPCLVVDDPLRALQMFAAYHREQFEIPVIAITGSCGKTSSKDLIAALLETQYSVTKTPGSLNNDIGLPRSLLAMDSGTGAAVLEIGANHKGEIAHLCTIAKPTESAITLVAEGHLEGFGSIEDVAQAKEEIVEGLTDAGVFYVNADDARCVAIAERFAGRIVRFGSSGDVVLESCSFNEMGEMDLRIDPIGELVLPLHARAHASNVLLAVAIGLQHGVVSFEEPLRRACAAASRFNVLRVGPLEVIDDSYNANPASMRAALEALHERPVEGARMAALGDMLELGEYADELHASVGAFAGECGITRLYLRGAHAEATARGAKSANVETVQVIDNHRDMASDIAAVAEEGDTLLVKGSRGMQMETVIDELRDMMGVARTPGA